MLKRVLKGPSWTLDCCVDGKEAVRLKRGLVLRSGDRWRSGRDGSVFRRKRIARNCSLEAVWKVDGLDSGSDEDELTKEQMITVCRLRSRTEPINWICCWWVEMSKGLGGRG